MKQVLYILILIIFFSCKNKTRIKEGIEIVEKDSITLDLKEVIPAKLNNIKASDSIYKLFEPVEVTSMQRRTVKAKNGLNIRDSLGNKIGKLAFGQSAYILNYSKDTIEIKDNNKIIKGRNAKIVIKWSNERIKVKENTYKHNWYVKTEDVGFVFEGFLYENYEADTEDSLYKFGYLVLGEKGEESNINLRELLEIKKVNLEKYKNRIFKEPEFKQPNTFEKVDKKIELPFQNGKKLLLKDSTYNSEYNPTKTYNVFYHKDFSDSYMVTENMFFMPEIHTELSIKTGDTLNRFNGYPYVSPNKKHVVLVTHDVTECYHDTYLEIHKKEPNGNYKRLLVLTPESWSYPFKKNKESGMDDIFTIHWLNDNEFIIKAVNYINDCFDPDQLSKPFYLKFIVKI